MDLENLSLQIASCTKCSLSRELPYCTNPLTGRGLPTARLVFVTERPGILEIHTGEIFSELTPHGSAFWRLVEEAGLLKGDIYVTSLVRCLTEKTKRTHVVACIDWLLHEMQTIRPERTFMMGVNVAKAIMKDGRFSEIETEYVPCASLWQIFNGGADFRKKFSKRLRGKEK